MKRISPFTLVLLVALSFALACPPALSQERPKDLPPQTSTSRNGTSCSGETRDETQVAAGVLWIHYCKQSSVGGPWSIHVLQVDRHHRDLQVRSITATDSTGQLTRVPLTELAARAASQDANVLAIVNGDFDLPEPYFGIPTGLAISAGKIWTSGGSPRPVMGILVSGRPVIGAPHIYLAAFIKGKRLQIATFNQPLDSTSSADLRLYSSAFRSSVKSQQPFRAVVINKLNPPLPPNAAGGISGVVAEIRAPSTEQTIPENALLLAEPADTKESRSKLRDFSPGARVTILFHMKVANERGVRDAIAGTPVLISDNHVAISGETTDYLKQRHPRTAVCYNQESYLFVVVDGRQPVLSVGMTLDELANFMLSIGCTNAMNTDGGGSTEMAIALPPKSPPANSGAEAGAPPKLQIVNSPSDGPERGRPNAWIVVRIH